MSFLLSLGSLEPATPTSVSLHGMSSPVSASFTSYASPPSTARAGTTGPSGLVGAAARRDAATAPPRTAKVTQAGIRGRSVIGKHYTAPGAELFSARTPAAAPKHSLSPEKRAPCLDSR